MKHLDRILSQNAPNDKKFICGDTPTIYDISVAGFFFNIALNPFSTGADGWKQAMSQHSTERVNKYLSDFEEVFKEYFDKRPKGGACIY